MSFEGTLTALVTPMRSDGEVDLGELAELVEWQIESGIDGLVPCGSTGESATLSHEEHSAVVRHVIEQARGRVPVIAGTGSNSTREAIALTREAKEAGADGALLISPYYNKPSQEGIYQHYRKVAAEVGLPIVIYNIPGRTASRIDPATSARLAQLPEVVALKEAGGDLVLSGETLAAVQDQLVLLSGDDALTLPLLALGGRGVISTTSNIAPQQMSRITRAYLSGDLARAREAHFALQPLMQALFCATNPVPIKAALASSGRIASARVRLPLTPLEPDLLARVESALQLCKPQ